MNWLGFASRLHFFRDPSNFEKFPFSPMAGTPTEWPSYDDTLESSVEWRPWIWPVHRWTAE